jgi:hypothetical protein
VGAEGHSGRRARQARRRRDGGAADPAIRKRFTAVGHEVAPVEREAPAGLAADYKAETDKWWPIIKAANLKMQ